MEIIEINNNRLGIEKTKDFDLGWSYYYFFDLKQDMSSFKWYKYNYQVIFKTHNKKEFDFIKKMFLDKNFNSYYFKNPIDLELSIQNYLKVDNLGYLKLIK